LAFAGISAAIESGEIDPRGKHFGDLMAGSGSDPARLMIDSEEQLFRPEPSPLGLSSHRARR
jgi:hypothetical protein